MKTDSDASGDDPGGMSRRAFLGMAWRKPDPGAEAPSAPGSRSSLIRLGETALVREFDTGTVQAVAEQPDIYGVRTETGVIAVRARCPHDGGMVAWRANERSEDGLADTGRFYCPHDASIFDRRGRHVAGPAPTSLDTLTLVERDGTLWVDPAAPVRDGTAEMPLKAGEG